MAKVSEKTVTRKIMTFWNGIPNGWCFKVAGGPYQRSGIPDIVGFVAGRFAALEVKVEGNKTSAIQDAVIAEICSNGGVAEVVYTYEDACAILTTLVGRGNMDYE